MSPRSIYILLNAMAVCMVISPLILSQQLLPLFLALIAIVSERLRKRLCISIIEHCH